jgi:hypothetical protein
MHTHQDFGGAVSSLGSSTFGNPASPEDDIFTFKANYAAVSVLCQVQNGTFQIFDDAAWCVRYYCYSAAMLNAMLCSHFIVN